MAVVQSGGDGILGIFKTAGKIGFYFFLLIIFITIFGGMFAIIETGTVGVKYTLGNISHNELTPGVTFLIPVINRVERVNVRVKTISYHGNDDMADDIAEGILNKPEINVLDKRGLPILVELTVLYQLKQSQASEIIEQYGHFWDEKMVNPAVREVIRDVMGGYEAETLPEKRAEITQKIKSSFQERLANSPIEVIDIQLRNIELPSQVQDKILQVQVAKQETERQKYELEKTKVQAETIRVEAEAKALANERLTQSLTDAVLKSKFLEKRDGVLPKVMGANSMIQLPIEKW